ncbi:uncharacterized protein UDID_19411 [Ustilago sp. UG-2017a]|nr:uncharacterized protein UDID_19411 [Ustilago sp. UG-2017a]
MANATCERVGVRAAPTKMDGEQWKDWPGTPALYPVLRARLSPSLSQIVIPSSGPANNSTLSHATWRRSVLVSIGKFLSSELKLLDLERILFPSNLLCRSRFFLAKPKTSHAPT